MSIPNEALHKLVLEIETQAVLAQQQIGQTRSQIATKQREQRLVRLTLGELEGLPVDAVVYEGVGKMFVSLPVEGLRQNLRQQNDQFGGDVERLNHRLQYLETTHKNSREHIEQILRAR